jgi:hypothetical protein
VEIKSAAGEKLQTVIFMTVFLRADTKKPPESQN